MKNTDPVILRARIAREEAFWNCCLELLPWLYIVIMLALNLFLEQYGVFLQDNHLEYTRPSYHALKFAGRKNALFIFLLMYGFLWPVRQGWDDFDPKTQLHTVYDWRFSIRKVLALLGSVFFAFLIAKTRFHVLKDEQIANMCRAALIGSGYLLGLLGHLIVRIALWRKLDPVHRLSLRADIFCEWFRIIAIILSLILGLLLPFLLPADGISGQWR